MGWARKLNMAGDGVVAHLRSHCHRCLRRERSCHQPHHNQQGHDSFSHVPREGVEPPQHWFVASCTSPLCYLGLAWGQGIEPWDNRFGICLVSITNPMCAIRTRGQRVRHPLAAMAGSDFGIVQVHLRNPLTAPSSEWRDSNPRFPGPKPGDLPN